MAVTLSEDARQITSSSLCGGSGGLRPWSKFAWYLFRGASLKNWLFLGIENLFGFWIVPIVPIVLLARQ
jgi:hypothetical protein